MKMHVLDRVFCSKSNYNVWSTRYGVATIRGSLKSQVSFAESSLFCGALLQQRPKILRGLLIVATP